MSVKYSMKVCANINQAIDVKDLCMPGEIVYDIDKGFSYVKFKDKFDIVTSEEDAPCLGSNCPKRDMCFKYNLSKQFSIEDFIIHDLSVETKTIDDIEQIYCCKSNKYRCFRWND